MSKPTPPSLDEVLADWGIELEPPNWEKVYESYCGFLSEQCRVPRIKEVVKDTGLTENQVRSAINTLAGSGKLLPGNRGGEWVPVRPT